MISLPAGENVSLPKTHRRLHGIRRVARNATAEVAEPFPSSHATYRAMLRVWGLSICLALTSIVASRTAGAQVFEPNGLQVPAACPAHETSLQAYFDQLVPPEPINATADASTSPGTFSPLCSFQAQLILSQSSGVAGLAWYNVPNDETSAPTANYPIIAETAMIGTMVSSAAIRADPRYAGGLIGFTLMVQGQPVYYSEYKRNVFCSGCTMPDHWKLMLAYPSKLASNAYYLAFEDWPGANATGWPDDGDFNDKVFKLTGIRCPGGGEPCDTGKLGPCAQGLTECKANQPLLCKQLVQPKPEICDGIDNDCDGVVDGTGLCKPGQVCNRGTCVSGCGRGEFICLPNEKCDEDYCIETACAGVRCEGGKVCRQGACVAACDGIVCPAQQACRDGQCAAPCAGIVCDIGRVCRGGVCVEKCDCGGCPSGLACDVASGACVDFGCPSRVCGAGTVCVKGECVDPCKSAKCPGGGTCVNGTCLDPVPPTVDAGARADGTPPVIVTGGTGGSGGSNATGGSGGSTTGGSGGTSSGDTRASNDASCSCRVTRSESRASWLVGVLGGAVLTVYRGRRAQASKLRSARRTSTQPVSAIATPSSARIISKARVTPRSPCAPRA
jgi:uncharacterized membrane protein YgcG